MEWVPDGQVVVVSAGIRRTPLCRRCLSDRVRSLIEQSYPPLPVSNRGSAKTLCSRAQNHSYRLFRFIFRLKVAAAFLLRDARALPLSVAFGWSLFKVFEYLKIEQSPQHTFTRAGAGERNGSEGLPESLFARLLPTFSSR
jgi:hypothetical protein